MNTSIILVGVGGQGTITTSNILTKGLIEKGYDVKMSEIHGMSQRGGTVVTQIKFGEKVHSPIIGDGEADIVVAFEKIEGLRCLNYLKEGGILVTDNCEINPMSVLSGAAEYPHDAIEKMQAVIPNMYVVEASQEAAKLGNPKCSNVILLGSLVKQLKLDDIDWKDVVAKTVPAKTVDLNVKAFETGYNM